MNGFFTFLHISGLAFWLETLIALVVIVSLVELWKLTQIEKKLITKIINMFNTIGQLSVIIGLISGIYKSIQINTGSEFRPFWLLYMEVIGGATLILSLIITTMMEHRINNIFTDLKELFADKNSYLIKHINDYYIIFLFIIFFVLSIIIARV